MQAILLGLTSCFLAIMAPIMLLSAPRTVKAEPTLLIVENAAANIQEKTVWLQHGADMIELPLEEYLVGVVLAEMPAFFRPEALKAQAVAARTFTMRMLQNGKHDSCDLCSDSSCCQAWSSETDMREKLGDTWEGYWEKAERAVVETEGEVITYDGQLIEAVYFSCSGGSTEPAVAVWGTDVPYLQAVDSGGEEAASKFKSRKELSISEFQSVILKENPSTDFKCAPEQWVMEVVASQGGGVEKIKIGGQWFSGTKIRSLFGLNSSKFYISVFDDKVTFEVLGYGHRVGMSQYGANAMAEEGYDYRHILKHYYTGVDIQKWK